MTPLSPADVRQLAAIESELATIRLGGRSAIDDVVPAMRRMLGVDSLLVYALAPRGGSWALSRWSCDGSVRDVPLRALAARMFATIPDDQSPVPGYDPKAPALSMRNRVVDAMAVVGSGWPETRFCRDLFRPIGWHNHRHLRALVCDGPELLAWVGTFIDGRPERQHYKVLSALIAPVQRRLRAERDLATGSCATRALDAALEYIGAPAFIVTARGAIRESNTAARVFLAEHRADVMAVIRDANRGGRGTPAIELTRISARGEPNAWLAVVRRASSDGRTRCAIGAAAARWSLTPRQQCVLEHVVGGASNAAIAASLGISERAVEAHLTRIFDRAGVGTRAALVAAVLAG